MAAPQSKSISSCSPLPSRPTNLRNSEISNPMRRSFSGNPFAKPSIIPNQRSGFNPNTPANSPSDHPRRNSIGRESVVVSFRDSEDKENGKDHKSKVGSVRSPASSKGTKNFMSPTISAASKINASPRKKILAERNESVRTSVSLSNGNGPLKEDSECKPEKGLNQKKEVSFNPTITYLEDKEEEALNGYEDLDSVVNSYNTMDNCDSFSESVAVENDFVNLDPSFKISPRTSSSLPSPALSPLDADPLMPPYDPKTNYLSPRPQFLHYKPNPRVELYLKQRDGKQLEESFACESSSDAEVTEQETVSDESSLDSHKESEDAASGDVVTEEEEELLVSEPNPITTFEGAIEARKVAKRHFLTRPKFTALLFVLALAGLWASVSNSPIMDPSVLNNLNFPNLYVPPEISEFTKENLEGLAQKFRQWLYDSLSFIHDLVISFREWHKPGRLQFANLTILLEESSIDNYLLVEPSTLVAEVIYERKGEVDVNTVENEGDQPIEAVKKVEQGPQIQPFNNQYEEIAEGDEFIEEVAEEGYNNEADESNEDVADDKGEESEYEEVTVDQPIEAVKKVEQGPEINNQYEEIAEDDEFIEEVAEEGYNNEADESNEDVADDKGEESDYEEVIVVPEKESMKISNVATDEATEPSNLATEVTRERVDIAENITVLPSKADITEQFVAVLNAEIEPEVSIPQQPFAENVISPVSTESAMAEFKPESLELDAAATMEQQIAGSVDVSVDGIKNLLSRQAMMGILLTVLSLIVVVPFIYMTNRTSAAADAAITADQVPVTKKADHSPLSATTGNPFQERSFSRHWQAEVETLGESCPSEMSSFLYSSSYSKQERGGTSEAQSQEKRRPRSNNRRESMASSDCSMGSASYGSFTTYEKVQIKLGNGEEEFLTPVRRSSRIRKQVTSP